MFFQRYVHVVLDAVLGSYVKNIDPDALKISVWNGKLEVEAVELQPEAFPLPPQLRMVKGTLHQLRVDLPWTNLSSQPIRVDIQDMSLLLEVCADNRAAADAEPSADEQRRATRKKLQTLQRKRAAIDAVEKATEFNEKNKLQQQPEGTGGWTQSFFFKLLVKMLDNVQVHIQHLHLRMEDSISDPAHQFAVGMTLEAIIIKSADEGWNYTMVGRGGANPGSTEAEQASFLRKKMDINKFGIYWSLPLVPVPAAVLDDGLAFAKLMQSNFGSSNVDTEPKQSTAGFMPLFKDGDYVVHPLTVSMKLTVNDGNAKLPITHQELSERVLSRLGTPWLVETIDAVGDDAWREFVATMPKLAGERKYTLGFVFSEAWSVARDLTEEEDEIPSVDQFKEALSSCLTWSLGEVDRMEHCIVKYREAVVHVMEEKSTYIDAQASIDQISHSLHRQQYLSALSFISFLTVKRRQARYLELRPKRVRVKDNPMAWWRYAIDAVLLDVRERLAHVDWEALKQQRQQRERYKELYLVLVHGATFAATLVSPEVRLLPKEMAQIELDDLEFKMDVKELIKLRQAVRKDIENKQKEKEALANLQAQQKATADGSAAGDGASAAASDAPPATGSVLWSYATWLTGAGKTGDHSGGGGGGGLGGKNGDLRAEDVKWSDQDTKDLYDAIDFHPQEVEKEVTWANSGKAEDTVARVRRVLEDHQHIWYRFQLRLCKASFGLSLDDAPVDLGGLAPGHEASVLPSSKAPRSSSLLASLDEVEIQFLVRPSCLEMGLQLRDAFFCQSSEPLTGDLLSHWGKGSVTSTTDFFLQRMDTDEVLEYHPTGVQNQMSSVRLRDCERELPLMQLSIESERQQEEEVDPAGDRSASGASDGTSSAARLLKVSLVTQAIKCNVNLMFLLDFVAVFSRPVNVDLSGLEQSAWKRAQSLQRYSAAQLRDALARRTKLEMRLDVISPLINIIQAPPFRSAGPTGEEVSLLVFLGHLKAATKHPSVQTHDGTASNTDGESEAELTVSRMISVSPSEESLYDVLEFSISGIEVQILDSCNNGSVNNAFRTWKHPGNKSSWQYLLEKTSLTFSFYMSVTPDDPSIPLLKLFGGLDSVNLNLSATSFRSLMQLLHSFGENFSAHAQRHLDREAAVASSVSGHRTAGMGQLASGAPNRSKPKIVKKSSMMSSGGSSGRHTALGGASPNKGSPSPYAAFAKKAEQERKPAKIKDIDDQDLLKLWKRVLCHLQFGVGEVIVKLQVRDIADAPGKIVRARAVDISTRLKVRTYDRRAEFALGTFLVEDILLTKTEPSPPGGSSEVVERKRFLMKSGNHDAVTDLHEEGAKQEDSYVQAPPPSSEQLIRVAITSIAADAVMLKDMRIWEHVRHAPLSSSVDQNSIWQDPLLTTLSLDVSLRVLTINFYQDTLAEIFVFFFKHKEEEAQVEAEEEKPLPTPMPSSVSNSKGDTAATSRSSPIYLDSTEVKSTSSPVGAEAHEETFSRKLSMWMSSSFLNNTLTTSPGSVKDEPVPLSTKEEEEDQEENLPASMQLRIHVDGLSLFFHLDDKQRPEGTPSAFASLTAQRFCCCMQRFPRYFSIFAYLSSLKIRDVTLADQHLSEIISHGSASGEAKREESWPDHMDGDGISAGHVPTLDEILNVLNGVPAIFSCAAQFYGADQIQEAWHPGYSSRYSVRFKSPRIRFLYSFVDDMQNYLLKGVLLQTVLSILSRERAEMLWEGDFQLADIPGGTATQAQTSEGRSSSEFLGSDVVSMFPLVDIQLEDAVLEMPPHRMSSESLLLRFDNFRVSNEGVVTSFLGMENRIVAKVLLNSSLKQLQLDVKALRIVSVILVDRDEVDKRLSGSGFVTQSLLGLTNFALAVDFRSHADLKLNLIFTPVRLVCNQEQYAFVLRVPYQNYRERSRYYFAQKTERPAKTTSRISMRRASHSRSLEGGASSDTGRVTEEGDEVSNKTDGTEPEERHILLDMLVPEITMELLQGQNGYHPSSSGDLDMAEKGKTNDGSICVLVLSSYSGRADYNFATSRFCADVDFEGVHIRDSRVSSKMSASYRDVVVFKPGSDGMMKAVSVQFARESFEVDVASVGLEVSFAARGKGPRTPRTRFRSVSSRALVGLFGSDLSMRRTNSEMSSQSYLSSTAVSHIGVASDVIEEEPSAPVVGVEARMDLAIEVAGFRVIPSNIYYDVLQFLEQPAGYAEEEGSVSSRDGMGGPDACRESEDDGNDEEQGQESTEEVMGESETPAAVPPVYRRIGLELNLGPSALLLVENPHKRKSRALMLSWEANIVLNYLRHTNEEECPATAPSGDDSPAHSHNQVQFCIGLDNIHATSRLSEDSIWATDQATSATSADCLKPIALETVLQMDLRSRFLRFRTTFDRVMELRFGYLDFCTLISALEHIVRRPAAATPPVAAVQKHRSMSGSSLSSLSGGVAESEASSWADRSRGSTVSPPGSGLPSSSEKRSERQRTAALYGTSLIYLVSASSRGRLETRPVVGFYNSTWRKRYLVLPYTAHQRQLVQSVAFRILPGTGSRRQLGDEIYYGDRIILEAVVNDSDDDKERGKKERLSSKDESAGTPVDTSTGGASGRTPPSTVIQKYDQLGAAGYLGPEGTAGVFETTIWKHGSTMFNSDKSVIYDREVIVLEELTIYRSFSKGKTFGGGNGVEQTMDFNSAKAGRQAEGAHTVGTAGARGGGYLMFNGVGDAPIPFALSIALTHSPGKHGEERGEATETEEVTNETDTPRRRRRRRKRKPRFQYSSFLENLKVVEFTLPGLNATVVNDFHNMLLPLLHFRVATLHADIRGRLQEKFTALTSLRFGIQAYNSQLAVWEPVIEDFEVNMAFHGKGGVLCEYCMSERQSVSPTGMALRCDGMPLCLFRASRTEVFTNAAAHSWDSKNFIYRELLEKPDDDGARLANTFMIVVKDGFNINVSRNVINVLLHFFALVTKVTASDEALATRLGPFIYVDNQSGIPFAVATHPSTSTVAPPSSLRRPTGSVEMPTEVPRTDTNEDIMQAETAMFNSHAWSRRRLSTMLNDISSSDTKWIRVESGARVATDIVAHEAPAGCVTSPLRRLLWLKPQSVSQTHSSSKAIPVPIGYSNRSYLHLESCGKQRDSWHGESIICETVAEQGTLVLRLRGKVQLTNFFSVPIQVIYNGERTETVVPGGKTAHYIPIQFLEEGTIAFCPLLLDGKVQRSEPLSIASLLRSNDTKTRGRTNRRYVGSLELRRALTFYWDMHPASVGTDVSFGVSLPPFQVIMTAARKSERHETTITLRPPVELENLVPYQLSYRTVCMKAEDEVVWVENNAASFSGYSGKVSSGSSACIAELEILERDLADGEVSQTPTVVGLSLAIPEIQLRRFSRWTSETFVYGCRSFCERIEINMRDDNESEGIATPANKLTICVEITQLEKLRSRALNALAPVVCRVFTEYWLIDRTSLSLAFYTADDYLIPSNHPGRLHEEKAGPEDESSTVSLSVFSCESKQVVSKMKIGIKGGKGVREVQSEPFDISAVGVRGQILVPTNRSRDARSLLSTIAEFGAPSDGLTTTFKQYEFGVMIEQGPTKFSRSRVVTLVPRYYFINTSNRFEIRIRQERSTDPSAVIVLRPKETKIFHWSDSRLPSRVQICFVLPDERQEAYESSSSASSSQWSSPFELSSVGNFVLRVKSKVRPAPPCLPDCYEGGTLQQDHFEEEDEMNLFYDEEDEYGDAERMLAEGIQLNVAVELHDPSFLVYLEEGNQAIHFSPPSSYQDEGREAAKHRGNEGFVPFKIKNECSNLELVVWQKTLVKDDKGNLTIGFEGGEPVLPFHTIDYVPYRFSAFPTVFVQVQKVAGLGIGALRKERPSHTRRRSLGGNSTVTVKEDKSAPVTALARAAAMGQAQVVASFEVQLKKLQRLPTIDISERKMKKRLWAEVLLDETTKTLLVTDMLPGVSGEHKRRRRATLLRSWKRYNTSIMFISHVLADHTAKRIGRAAQEAAADEMGAKKKHVRFAEDVSGSKGKRDTKDSADASTLQAGDAVEAIEASVFPEGNVEALALCVRLVDAAYLEDVFLQAGRNDLSKCQPFITFALKTDSEEARTKLAPQPTTMFPRWLPALSAKAVLSVVMTSNAIDAEGNPIGELGANAELVVEIREADKLMFGSSVVATVHIPLEEYCAAAMISARGDASHEPQVAEFLAPVRITRKGDEWSRGVEGETRIRFQMCCRRTFVTRSSGAKDLIGKEAEGIEAVQEMMDMLASYQLKKDLDVLSGSKSQLKLLLEREAVDTSTGGGNLPAALRAVPGLSSSEESKSSGLARLAVRSEPEEEGLGSHTRSSSSIRSSVVSGTTDESTSDGTYEDMGDEKRLTAVLIGVANLQIPTEIVRNNFERTHGTTENLEPKVYCTITYQESTRSALSAIAKPSGTSASTGEDKRDRSDSVTSENSPRRMDPANSNAHLQQVRTYEFPRGQMLGLDLVYRNGRVLVQGVVCDGPCGPLIYEGKIRIGDTVVAANNKSIMNLHRDASFAVIEKAMHGGDDVPIHAEEKSEAGSTFTLSFLYQPTAPQRMTAVDAPRPPCAQKSDDDGCFGARKYDAEWNRRVEFVETPNAKTSTAAAAGGSTVDDERVLVRVYLRNETSDHGLSASQESSIVPFLYFFGDDAMMDHLDHSKQDSRFDVLLAECWVPLPPSSLSGAANPMAMDGNPMAEQSPLTFNERICALYSPQQRAHQHSALEMIGQLRLALKWDFINPLSSSNQHSDLSLYCQLEVARICISIVDDGSASSAAASAAGPPQPQEVLCISLSDQNASAGVQLSYGHTSDGKRVLNARVGHFQVDNQLLDTNYPVLLRPMRLVDTQMQEEGNATAGEKRETTASGVETAAGPILLPTFQLMAVFSWQPNVIQFDYIFGQLQELEIKLEDATLVALAKVFSGVDWSLSGSRSREEKPSSGVTSADEKFGSNLALRLLEVEWSTPTLLSTTAGGRLDNSRGGGNMKVLLRWLLLCPVKVNVTFTSTADRSLLLSMLSPDMSSVLSTLISAAAALVSNLDQAPIRVPEFYVENLLETTHTLAFYAMQHYLHHGLRSWYNIMGSVDFLGNPIGLVSTLGTGVKDFFYTPAQMLLEDEKGLRIENLRTGMTKGSKSLLRNTAVGIFHTTGKITETLGKGIAMLAMDEQYNVQRQRQSTRQVKKINDLGDAIAEGSKGLVGGVWDGIKGIVAAPMRGAERDGAGGFVVGIGKGFAGLLVKPTAGFLDLLTSLSRGAKTSAEALDGTDGRNAFDMVTRFRLPRRICADGVLVSYSEREARGYAVLLLTSLDATDEYVYHVDYGIEPHRGLLLLTDKRLICMSAKTGQKLWELALDSTLEVGISNRMLEIGQAASASPSRAYKIECDDDVAASNFRLAVDSARVDLSATRYLLLNLEKNQEESRIAGGGHRNGGAGAAGEHDGLTSNEDERTDLHVLMENVQDTTVPGLSDDDLQTQPLRSVRVELCHLQNKDAHANVPSRAVDRLLSFSVFQVQVYGGPYQWTVFRRFSEFRELHTVLQTAGYELDGLPPLPPRTFLPSTRVAVAKHRQEALSAFLEAAIMHSTVSRSAAVLDFVTREAREVRVSLPPLSPSGEHEATQRAEEDSP